MNLFSTYTAELGKYTSNILVSPTGSFRKTDIEKSLFSAKQVERHLRALIPIEELRDAGSFFTGDDMAVDAADCFGNTISRKSFIIDPACGAGNLLIASSKKLPVFRSSLRKTLTVWGQCLAGFDLFPEFVDATKLRLILEAVSRGAVSDLRNIEDAKKLFPFIQEGDAFVCGTTLANATHIIINPPYYKMDAAESCEWADGKINAAAKFMDLVALNATKGTLVSAILPDVLRSGSRYAKWRGLLSSKFKCSVLSAGRFDSNTDVDVFLLSGEASPSGCEPDWLGVKHSAKTVGNYFDISIGPVVPYRDKKAGKSSPYIHPRQLPLWTEVRVEDIEETWDYAGTLKTPPFIAIRRTSSPSDAYRAGGILINGKLPVAVENHLIVVRPKSGRVGDCRKLLKVLQNKNTNDFLNQRIRCRHLTVSAVKEIPWIGESL
jgi:hypothetical protein